jgi:hypothetical protein
VPSPASAAFQNLRSLVFRYHALNLEQEIIFRRAADRMVQKNNLRAHPVKLLDQKDLMRITPDEPVGGVDINSRDDPRGHGIPQLFQSRTKKNRSAVSLVHIGVVRQDAEAVGRNALLERRDLTSDRIVTRLTVARDPRIESNAISYDHDFSPPAILVLILAGGL